MARGATATRVAAYACAIRGSREMAPYMPNRSHDWLAQAHRDLEQAEDSRSAGRDEWACFAAHQAAEKAVKALHLFLGQEAWGHVVARLLQELPVAVPGDLVERSRVLDTFY